LLERFEELQIAAGFDVHDRNRIGGEPRDPGCGVQAFGLSVTPEGGIRRGVHGMNALFTN
jgi:hypothetical protein